MAKRIIALLLALSLVFAFAACKKSDKEDETTAPETEIVTDENGETQFVEVEDETDAEEATNAEGEVVTDAEATEEATKADGKPAAKPEANKPEANKPAANKIPSTPAEVVAAFNAAANAVKADKPGYSKTEHNIIDKIETGTILDKIIPGIVKAFPTEGPSANVAKGASHNDFPVAGGKTALTAGMVKSATAKAAANGGYTVTIYMKDERLESLPVNPNSTNHGKAFNVLSKAVVDEQVAGIPGVKITKFQPTYTGSYVKATINADGKMVKAEYLFYTKAVLAVSAMGIKLDVKVPFGVKQNYTIKY